MTKWKRLLAAVLILSMLSGNVAYAAPGDVKVTVAETETTMEETQVSTVIETAASTETITQEVASTVEETVETTETAMPESSVEETESAVETTEASGEEAVETTVEATETTEVTTQEEVETITETEVTVVETVVEATSVEEETTEVPVEDVGLYSQYLPESLTLYADTWQGFYVDVPNYDATDLIEVSFEMTKGYDNIEIIPLETKTAYWGTYKFCYFMVKPSGESSLTATIRRLGEETVAEIPVYIADMPSDCVKIEDAGWFNFWWGRGNNETYITETRMESVKTQTTFGINCSQPKVPDEAFSYMKNCTDLTITYSTTAENWEMDYAKVANLPLQTLSIYNDSYLEELELAFFPLLNKLRLENTNASIKATEDHSNIKDVAIVGNTEMTDASMLEHMPNLETVTFSKCDKLSDISNFTNVQTLKNLVITECSNLTKLLMFANAPLLEQFTISSCDGLEDFSELADAPALKQLTVSKCSNLSDISALSSVKNLEKVKITDCEKLVDVSPLKSCSNLTG